MGKVGLDLLKKLKRMEEKVGCPREGCGRWRDFGWTEQGPSHVTGHSFLHAYVLSLSLIDFRCQKLPSTWDIGGGSATHKEPAGLQCCCVCAQVPEQQSPSP